MRRRTQFDEQLSLPGGFISVRIATSIMRPQPAPGWEASGRLIESDKEALQLVTPHDANSNGAAAAAE
jgi:hypothetical protein